MAELQAQPRAEEQAASGKGLTPELARSPFSGCTPGSLQSHLIVVRAAALLVELIALLVLTGWLFDIRVLKSVLPVLTTMKANTAVCLSLTAVALWLSRTETSRRRHAGWVWILMMVVSFVAIITLCEYAFNWNAGLDELLFHDPEHTGTAYPPGRLAPATAACFLLLSSALVLLDSKPRLSHGLILATTFVVLVSLIGYLYGLPTLYGASRYTSLALHTIAGFLILCVGLLASRPDRGLTALLVASRGQRSHVHTLITGAVLLPMLLGSLALKGQRLGWYGGEFTLALFSVLLIVLSVALVWVIGAAWQRIEWRRLQMEKALRVSEEHFHTLADYIPNLAWMADAEGHIFWYNQRWYNYTGATPEQMQREGWQMMHDPQILSSVQARWQEVLTTGVPFEMVFPLRGADGVFRPFLTRVQPIRGEDGRVARWFGTNTDISAEREAHEELRKANRELQEFAFVASHDLQEPLRTVNSFTQLLLREIGEKLDGRTKQYAAYVQDGAKRMNELIVDLLQFSRLVSSGPQDEAPPVAMVDLNLCVQKALVTLSLQVQETEAVITLAPLPKVPGEESQWTQVFQNLLSNALKYRQKMETPHIDIWAQEEEGAWKFGVQDNGIGFEPQYAERIFGLFKRLHKNEYPGTGLGLTICQRIVERQGGRIWAESTLGGGARFSISVPRVKNE